MIKAQNLTKNFRTLREKKTAVDNLSFEVATGKVTGFLGPNGAGKSTTMRLMLGLDTCTGLANRLVFIPAPRRRVKSRTVGQRLCL